MNSQNSPSRFHKFVEPFTIDGALLLYRIALGALLMSHGWGKIFSGAEGVIKSAASMGFPLPEFFGWAAAISEFVGGLMIVFGLLTRPWAVLGAITMMVAAFMRHADDPWSKKELGIVYLIMLIVLFLTGPGKYSLDQMLFGRRKNSN